MATAVIMPKLGNSVESCIIVRWHKKQGDQVTEKDILAEIETDKATLELESPASGTLLEIFFKEGDEVPVLTHIAAIGQAGEDAATLRPTTATNAPAAAPIAEIPTRPAALPKTNGRETALPPAATIRPTTTDVAVGVSPRAKNLAISKGLDLEDIQGTGPHGRIIERDIQAALAAKPQLTPLAKSMLAKGEFIAPEQGSGVGGRITSKDLLPAAQPEPQMAAPAPTADETQVIPLKGMRKVIATRMLNSMQTTAQLTLNAAADARALLAYRKQLKNSPEALGLQNVTINDLVMFAVSRTLLQYPDLNAYFADETITQFKTVHLGFAVDTPRGLIVPVIRRASQLSLKQLAQEAGRLARACQDGSAAPDDLGGGTFTVTNLGSLGIESFTPVLNVPQVAILGVGNINLKPVEVDGDVQFIPHLGLSLTINHQVIDGAPGARFL
ncbi:MAG TPA: dihydrolipoamide acetyltransferase family protein, partial [Phototrophicaceae bacterium]|nr:dihydrolipoamide acetyltransferase family protein [Phototrophicaceae bacterium]